jgi:hypothetical protein
MQDVDDHVGDRQVQVEVVRLLGGPVMAPGVGEVL